MKILVIDNEKYIADPLGQFIRQMGNEVTILYSCREALKSIVENSYDLIISDVSMPDISGLDLVKYIQARKLPIRIVLISGHTEIIDSINAMENGVYDVLSKPVDIRKIASLITGLYQNKPCAPPKNSTDTYDIEELISYNRVDRGKLPLALFSDRIFNLYKKLKKLQDFPEIPILITGETGTGKEVLAKYIHFENFNQTGNFVGLNCSAIPRDLFESELFGYEPGAFTGANIKGSKGKISQAENGSLFLDEISEMLPEQQTKLLRIVQERNYYSIGGTRKKTVKARILCATNRNLEDLVEKNLFRNDLYYRINVCGIHIPPLRERVDEIVPLAAFFISEINKRLERPVIKISDKSVKKLQEYPWPGNIRELKNCMMRSLLFNETTILKAENILIDKTSFNANSSKKTFNFDKLDLPKDPFDLNTLIKNIVKKALEKNNGNKTQTAKYLGLNRIQLYRHYNFDDVSNDA